MDDPVHQEEMRQRNREHVKRGNAEQRTEMLGSCILYLLVAVPVMSGEESNFVPFETIKTYILTSKKPWSLRVHSYPV